MLFALLCVPPNNSNLQSSKRVKCKRVPFDSRSESMQKSNFTGKMSRDMRWGGGGGW